MSWRLARFKSFAERVGFPAPNWPLTWLAVGYLTIFELSVASAVDSQRLWLPVKYQTRYLDLIRAAETAEAIDRCVSVVEGTLDLEQSQPQHPIYRILCRQENGRTYNEMVDGLTFATLTTPKIVEPVLTPEEQERMRQQEEVRRLAEIAHRKATAWQACRQELVNRTHLMMELHWAEDLDAPLEPTEFTAEAARFFVNFNARSMWGEPLRYTAECAYTADSAVVTLRKR